MSKALCLALAVLGAASALAEEVIVTPGVATAPDRAIVREHDRARGCDSQTVHKENDAGDSKTVTKTECD